MEKSNNLYLRPVIIALLTAIVIMFVFGTSNRILTNRLSDSQSVSPMSPDALNGLSMQIGNWTGQDKPLDAAIIEATNTDAHISRVYQRNSMESVWLYVAAGRRTRDLMPHRPEVCYIGAGWTRLSSKSENLLLDEKTSLPCNIFRFSRGVLNTSNVIILDYYIVDGQYSRDVSLLRSKIWKGYGTVKYSAQIQVVAPVTTDHSAETAKKLISDFAADSARSIFDILQNAADNQKQGNWIAANDYSGDSGSERKSY
jgi:EpsI family protein